MLASITINYTEMIHKLKVKTDKHSIIIYLYQTTKIHNSERKTKLQLISWQKRENYKLLKIKITSS